MNIFISGTNTNIGKTICSAWLCSHSHYAYYKPIQTGTLEDRDSATIHQLSPHTKIYPETYQYMPAVSPHLAAAAANQEIDIHHINPPQPSQLIIEGAGGLLVPINQKQYIIDLIKHLTCPVILIASSQLGTINHSLLSLEALQNRNIPVLGVIVHGPQETDNANSIAKYGQTQILAELPYFGKIDHNTLLQFPLTTQLKTLLSLPHA